MEDHEQQRQQREETKNPLKQSSVTTDQRNESVRSRWTPKPEQILILESIFNSGMVNPPKEETVRIRKLLEKFGSVGDANVFYWFQNRRSKSRRRQRQIQASLCAAAASDQKLVQTRNINIDGGAIIQHQAASPTDFQTMSTYAFMVGSSSHAAASAISQQNDFDNEILGFPGQTGNLEAEQSSSSAGQSVFCPSNINHNFQYQSGFITVLINGLPTEVPRGLIDTRAMFGQDFVLFHSSGVPVAVNEYGFLLECLHQGGSYFLVQRPA